MANENLDDPNIGLAKDKRRTVHIILGNPDKRDGPLLATIQLSESEGLPDVLHYDDRLYIKRDDARYTIAKAFPLVKGVDHVRELDGARLLLNERDTAQA
jgi:hypothetical protein